MTEISIGMIIEVLQEIINESESQMGVCAQISCDVGHNLQETEQRCKL